MKKELDMVAEFHNKYELTINTDPTLISKEYANFRHQLTDEEMREYLEGVANEDLSNIAKELADVLFAVYGTVVSHGLQDVMPDVFNEVYRSNMSKDVNKDADNTKPVKGKHYLEADIEKFFPEK